MLLCILKVITSGKPFQNATQLTPHMLTTTSTPGQGGTHPANAGAKVQAFPGGYLPIPTSATPGGGQTLVFGQLEVLGSPQAQHSISQQQQQQNNAKTDQVQKVNKHSVSIIINNDVSFIHDYLIICCSTRPAQREHHRVSVVLICSLHPGNLHLKFGPVYNNLPC